MPKRRKSRIYWRTQGGERRAYVDLRDLGEGREALIPSGETQATTDPDVAQALATARVKELEESRRRNALLGVRGRVGLKVFGAHHLEEKARTGKTVTRWLSQHQAKLEAACEFFGEDRELLSIDVADVHSWANHLRAQENGRGGTLSEGSIRHYLNVLSNLYRRAQAERYVPPGFNPVAAMLDKPVGKREEAKWLEVHDAALLLESARLYQAAAGPQKQAHGGAISPHAYPWMYPLLATFLLTGGRKSEVLGLEVEDVSFRRKTITFRPNDWRRLKTATSHRTVPLWPQLEEILREYLLAREREGGIGSLLFPSARGEKEGLIRDIRKALDIVAKRAGWKDGEIRSKMFRHTYCAARLQTVDQGAPVSPFTVGREMGHGGTRLVERIYGHLGATRHRAQVVEFRVENHQAELAERMNDLCIRDSRNP